MIERDYGIRALEWFLDLGFGKSGIARMLGAQVSDLDRWIRADVVPRGTPILLLSSDLHYLQGKGVEDVAAWAETPIIEGHPETPIDMWATGLNLTRRSPVALAMKRITPEEAMDGLDPRWRDRPPSEYEVFKASDGLPSIRRRS